VPTDETVELSGRVSRLAGRCPTVTFQVEGRSIATDRHTDYRGKKTSCDDLRNDRQVTVRGRVYSDGSVLAQRIELTKDD
jgi:hypothetical protein